MNNRNTDRPRYRLLVIAALALCQAGLVHAAGVTEPDIKVPYQRSSLDTTQGATALLKRIETAAARVCAPFDHADVASRARRDDCRTKLTETAVSEVNHPMLMSVYAAHHQATSRLLAAK